MKTILTVATALVTGLFFSSSAIAEDAKPAEWLFVHTAEIAKMTSATTLVMPVTREIFAFTDRPNRMHSYMNAHEFVSLWDEGEGDTFKADPPNAVLTWVDGDEMKEVEVRIISAETVSHGRGISYEVKLEAGAMPAESFSGVSVFIDNSCTVNWGGQRICTRPPIPLCASFKKCGYVVTPQTCHLWNSCGKNN